jgi:hypothetical protein
MKGGALFVQKSRNQKADSEFLKNRVLFGGWPMTKSGDMHDNARKLKEMAEDTPDAKKKRRYGKMSRSWTRLANTQARLDGEGSQGVGSSSRRA